MVTSELTVQAAIVKSTITLGGYGFKTDNKHIAGLPDLFLAMPHVGSAYVEVKLLPTVTASLPLTPLQRDTLRRMQDAGVWCGWFAAVKVDKGYALFAHRNYEVCKINPMFYLADKVHGSEWPIPAIISSMRQPVALTTDDERATLG